MRALVRVVIISGMMLLTIALAILGHAILDSTSPRHPPQPVTATPTKVPFVPPVPRTCDPKVHVHKPPGVIPGERELRLQTADPATRIHGVRFHILGPAEINWYGQIYGSDQSRFELTQQPNAEAWFMVIQKQQDRAVTVVMRILTTCGQWEPNHDIGVTIYAHEFWENR